MKINKTLLKYEIAIDDALLWLCTNHTKDIHLFGFIGK